MDSCVFRKWLSRGQVKGKFIRNEYWQNLEKELEVIFLRSCIIHSLHLRKRPFFSGLVFYLNPVEICAISITGNCHLSKYLSPTCGFIQQTCIRYLLCLNCHVKPWIIISFNILLQKFSTVEKNWKNFKRSNWLI